MFGCMRSTALVRRPPQSARKHLPVSLAFGLQHAVNPVDKVVSQVTCHAERESVANKLVLIEKPRHDLVYLQRRSAAVTGRPGVAEPQCRSSNCMEDKHRQTPSLQARQTCYGGKVCPNNRLRTT